MAPLPWVLLLGLCHHFVHPVLHTPQGPGWGVLLEAEMLHPPQGQWLEPRGTSSIPPCPRAGLLPPATPRPGTGRRPQGPCATEAAQSHICRCGSCPLLPSLAKGQVAPPGQPWLSTCGLTAIPYTPLEHRTPSHAAPSITAGRRGHRVTMADPRTGSSSAVGTVTLPMPPTSVSSSRAACTEQRRMCPLSPSWTEDTVQPMVHKVFTGGSIRDNPAGV